MKLLPLFGATLALLCSPSAAADVLIDNVKGVRIDEDGDVDRFTGLWVDDDGTPHGVTSQGLNAYLAEAAGKDGVTAKVFRTWTGTLAAFRTVLDGEGRTIKALCDAAADRLQNTPAIARKSYIHPAVIELAGVERPKLPKPDRLPGLAAGEGAVIVCGRFEGVDERIIEGRGLREVSIGDYVLAHAYLRDDHVLDAVLPPDVTARVAVEKASILGWTRYTGLRGQIIGMRTFGASAPLAELQRQYGFTPGNIVAAAKEQVANART